jgi:hypothetical protein
MVKKKKKGSDLHDLIIKNHNFNIKNIKIQDSN